LYFIVFAVLSDQGRLNFFSCRMFYAAGKKQTGESGGSLSHQ
jgi:hypothetical protein